MLVYIDNTDKELDEKTIQEFMDHPICNKVLDALSGAFQGVPSTALAAGAAALAGAHAGFSIPVLASASASAVTLASILHTPNTTSYLPCTVLDTKSSPNSIADNITLAIARTLQCMSDTDLLRVSDSSKTFNPQKGAHVDDRWLAGSRAETPHYGTAREVRTFQPKNLTLFHITLLAHVVHTEYPIYSLFKNQCCWFSNIIYDAAKIIDSYIPCGFGTHLIADDLDPNSTLADKFFMPFYLYMPEEAGRWLGVKICEVEKIILRHIVEKFKEQLKDHMKEVFQGYFHSQLLQFTYILTD